MNHDPFKINGAILDMWRDLKAGDDYIHRLEVRNAELVTANARLKAEVERLHRNGDLMLKFAAANMTYPAYATMAKDWNAAKGGKPSV